jgi:hypothetical protein
VVDVPGATGSEVFGAGPIAREPDPDGADVDGGGVVVWANDAPEIEATTPVTMMKGLSIERTSSRDLQVRFIAVNRFASDELHLDASRATKVVVSIIPTENEGVRCATSKLSAATCGRRRGLQRRCCGRPDGLPTPGRYRLRGPVVSSSCMCVLERQRSVYGQTCALTASGARNSPIQVPLTFARHF